MRKRISISNSQVYFLNEISILILLVAFFSLSNAFALETAEQFLNKGIECVKKGDYDQAILEYTKALELKPNDANIYNMRGNAYHGKGNYDQAILDFSKAIKLNPSDAATYEMRGNAYYQKEEYGKAWADLQKIEELGGKPNPDFVKNLMNVYGRRKINVYLIPQ